MAVPENRSSWRFGIFEGSTEIGTLDLEADRDHIRLVSGAYGISHRVPDHTFIVGDGESVYLEARQRGPLFPYVRVRGIGGAYVLKEVPMLSRRFLVYREEENEVVGKIRPRKVLSKQARLDLPAQMPLVERLFILWMVLLQWKRTYDLNGMTERLATPPTSAAI